MVEKQVLDSTGVWRSAKVIEEKNGAFLIHFENFTKKHDGFYDKGF